MVCLDDCSSMNFCLLWLDNGLQQRCYNNDTQYQENLHLQRMIGPHGRRLGHAVRLTVRTVLHAANSPSKLLNCLGLLNMMTYVYVCRTTTGTLSPTRVNKF
jgi:hypothetical protein